MPYMTYASRNLSANRSPGLAGRKITVFLPNIHPIHDLYTVGPVRARHSLPALPIKPSLVISQIESIE